MAPSDSARAAHAFCTIRSRKYDDEVQFYAFDIQVSDGEDLRTLRKNNLARLLARRIDGNFLSDFEHGEIGPTYSATPA